MRITTCSPYFFAGLLAFGLACGEPAGAEKTVAGGFAKKKGGAFQKAKPAPNQAPEVVIQARNLEIELFSGDFAQWSSATQEGFIENPTSKRLSWKNLRSDLSSAQWRVHEGAPADQGGKFVAQGAIGTVPAKDQSKVFNINFSNFLPGYPPSKDYNYYVQVIGKTSGNNEVTASQALLVRYNKPSQDGTTFTDEGLGLDVKGANKELYANSPMPVEIRLETLAVGQTNEDDADEPYLIVAAIAVDGTTINVLDFSSSTVRTFKSAGAHGNVPEVEGYGTVQIPTSTGRFKFKIDPLGKDFLADFPDPGAQMGKIMRSQTKIYLLVVAMEEDNATDAAANAARQAFFDQLQIELDKVVQSINLVDLKEGKTPQIDVGAITQRVQDAAIDAALNKSLDPANSWWAPVFMPVTTLMQAANPDDFVGATMVEFSFGELLDAWPQKVNFSMTLTAGDGNYTVKGYARRDVGKGRVAGK